MIKEFTRHHMKVEQIKIEEELAHKIWAKGVRSPPRKIRVRMSKTDEGYVLVSLYTDEVESKVIPKKETKKASYKEEPPKEVKTEEPPKEVKTEEPPKEVKTEEPPKEVKTEEPPKEVKTEEPPKEGKDRRTT